LRSTLEEKQAQVWPDKLVAISTRVSDQAHQANPERQARSLEDYFAAKGYRVQKVVKEIDSEVNDNRVRVPGLARAISA
jgi:predicted site-specific integrase-resolvase